MNKNYTELSLNLHQLTMVVLTKDLSRSVEGKLGSMLVFSDTDLDLPLEQCLSKCGVWALSGHVVLTKYIVE